MTWGLRGKSKLQNFNLKSGPHTGSMTLNVSTTTNASFSKDVHKIFGKDVTQ